MKCIITIVVLFGSTFASFASPSSEDVANDRCFEYPNMRYVSTAKYSQNSKTGELEKTIIDCKMMSAKNKPQQHNVRYEHTHDIGLNDNRW